MDTCCFQYTKDMRRILLSTIVLLSLNTLSFGQQFDDPSQEIPFDEEYRRGVLPNGIHYYVRHNEKPDDRASFYIIQNVGAVLENEGQDGLAHFLEHMAFNGTSTFPHNSMLDMLERYGVKFGKDVNAYTAHNETVYNISRVPSTDPALVDSCLMILRDWCNELSLDVEEIDAERGVIVEEDRSRAGLRTRLNAQLDSVTYNGSIYANRPVIGDMDVVRNFDPQVLRDFYHDWYRTDLQAVAIVGDIDVDQVEQKVIEMFSAIPAVENPRERSYAKIADNEAPLYGAATDKEVKDVTIKLSIRSAYEPGNSYGDLRENYVRGFFFSMLSNRINEIKASGDAPFYSGGVSYGRMVKGYNTLNISARAKDEKELEAFGAIYTELQRAMTHGFTEGELNRFKKNMLVSAQRKYDKRDQINSDAYASSVKSAYLYDVSIPDSKFTFDFINEVIPTITIEEVTEVIQNYIHDKNWVFTVIGPDSKADQLPTKEQLLTVIDKVEQAELAPYVYEELDDSELLKKEPKGGKIVAEKALSEYDAVEWTLSNGARVVYRYADYQKQSVALKGISPGGSSLYEVEDIPALGGASSFVKSFGIGKFDAQDYKKAMTGVVANSGFSIGQLFESVTAASSTQDVETMMKLVYMRFEEPRFDEDKYEDLMERSYESLERKVETGRSRMKDTLNAIMSNGNPRSIEFDKNYLNQITLERIEEIYRERFTDASDFTFFIVGDIDQETLKPLVEKYLGSIKDIDREENWIAREEYFPQGRTEHRIGVQMEESKSSVIVKMKAGTKYSREQVVYHSILGEILKIRYTKNIREKEGGTYGVSVKTGSSRIPHENLSMTIAFDCDPEKADYLKTLVYQELEIIQQEVREDDLEKVVLNMKKSNENGKASNGYWMSVLQTYYKSDENALDPAYYEDILEEVTAKDIQKAAKRFLKSADLVDILFYPESDEA